MPQRLQGSCSSPHMDRHVTMQRPCRTMRVLLCPLLRLRHGALLQRTRTREASYKRQSASQRDGATSEWPPHTCKTQLSRQHTALMMLAAGNTQPPWPGAKTIIRVAKAPTPSTQVCHSLIRLCACPSKLRKEIWARQHTPATCEAVWRCPDCSSSSRHTSGTERSLRHTLCNNP